MSRVFEAIAKELGGIALNWFEYRKTTQKNTLRFLIALERVIRDTEKQINSVGYKPNKELSDKWLDLCELAYNIKPIQREIRMLVSLIYKSRFWLNPEEWEKTGGVEIIPKLPELREYVNSTIDKIGKK